MKRFFLQTRTSRLLETRNRHKEFAIKMLQLSIETENISVLLEKAVLFLKPALNIFCCGIFELTPDGHDFLTKFNAGQPAVLGKKLKLDADTDAYPGCALASNELFMVENFTTESRFTVPPVFTDCGFKSGMCMRLGEAAQPYGIMGVYSTDHSTFNAEDIEFFQSIIQILMSAVIRIQAVENLKKSRSDLSHIFRIARMGNWEWNLKTGDIYWSDTIFQYIGIPKQSPSIILAESLTYPDDLKRVQNTLKQLYDEREFVQIDYRVVRPDSQIIWISNEVKVIKDNNGRASKFFGIIQDITERKTTEQTLRESRQQYRSVVESTYEIIAIVQDNIIRHVNPSMERITGYTPEEVVGKRFAEFIYHKDLRKAYRAYKNIDPNLLFRRIYRGRLKHKNGSLLFCGISAGSIMYDGQPAHLMTARDITEQIQFEKKKEQLFLQTLQKAVEMEGMFNATRMLLEEKAFKPVARRLFETCRQLTGGQFGYIVLLSEDGTKSEVQFIETGGLACGVEPELPMPVHGMWETAFHFDKPLVENNFSTSRWARGLPARHVAIENIIIVRLEISGKITGLMGIANKSGGFTQNDAKIAQTIGDLVAIFLKDIRMQKALGRSEKRLRQAQKMESIGTLAGGIAHDFNNILSSMLGNVEISRHKIKSGSPIHENLLEIQRAAHRAKDLVNRILTFARQSESTSKPVQVSLIAKEVSKLIRASISKSIQIIEHIKTNAMVMADPVEIHQIFMNLCTNAAYAMKKSGGFLVVRLEDIIIDENFSVFHGMITPGAYIRIAITDTGDGIPPDAMDLIFEPYYTTKPLGEGTGLGLYVTHSIVKECRGTITVNSEKGKGSCFEIYFPIIKDIKEKTDEEEKKVPVQIGNERILFVDDELQLVKLGRRRLESLGYQISGRTNSIETLQAFKAMPAL